MSKLQGKPFIELVIDTLDADKKKDLLDLVNGSEQTPAFRSLINASALITGADKNKVQFVVLETWNKTYTGYLIYNNSYCVLVAFHNNTQELQIVDIDLVKQAYKLIKQPLSIVEFRMYLMEANDHITPGEIDSGEAEANALLVADGDGGAEFVSPADGSAQYLLGLDSQGNIIKDELPEGIVVDENIIEDSPNAVAGGAVYDALAEKADASDVYTKTQVDAALEEKANVDGNYPTMTVGAADNLTPYDEESGTDQEQPFLLQGTGCGNGEQQVDTGALALLKEKQGHSVVVNNQIQNGNFASSSGWTESNVSATFSDNQAHIVGTGNANGSIYRFGNNKIEGHKYLIMYEAKASANGNAGYGFAATYKTTVFSVTTSWQLFADIITAGSTDSAEYIYYGGNGETLDVKNFVAIDLTQWFGSNDNIPAHLLSHPEDFFRYYQGSLAYNEGELVNSNGRYLKTIGRNVWDEEWETDGSWIWSKNKLKVVPNYGYYYKGPSAITLTFYDTNDNSIISYSVSANNTFTVPSNACSMSFALAGSTYNNDITISIYYDGESGYDQYYPYEELANIDTGTETLRSAGSVKDSKLPDGTIKRNVGVVDLSTLSWTYVSANNYYTSNSLEGLAKGATRDGVDIANVICSSATPTFVDNVYLGNNGIGIQSNGTIYFKNENTDENTTPTGTLYYELAEPTTEQGTQFSENLVIDDFGSMDFGGTNGVPQGAELFYALDYKAFIDSLYNTLDGDATDIVKESELDSKLATLGYVKLTSVSGYDATKTQTLKNVEGTLTWVDD